MASPQCENGYTKIANELLEAILRGDFSKRELLILFAIIRKTYGYSKAMDKIYSSQLAELTGLIDTNCRAALRSLKSRSVILEYEGGRIGIQKDYEQWAKPDSTRPGSKRSGQADQNDPGGGSKRSGQTDQNDPGERIETIRGADQNDPAPGSKRSGNPDQNDPHKRKKENLKTTTKESAAVPAVTSTASRSRRSRSRKNAVAREERAPHPTPVLETPPTDSAITSEAVKPAADQPDQPPGLVFPCDLSAEQRRDAARIVATLNGQRQDALDELAGIIADGQIKTSKLACLRGIVRNIELGDFTLNHGERIKAARTRTNQPAPEPPAPLPTTDVLRRHAQMLGIPEEDYLERFQTPPAPLSTPEENT